MLFGRRNRIFCACRHLGGGGRLLRNLSDNYAHSGALNATENLSAEEEKIAAEMQADLLAGTLELDPENDPVLGTTESGIEIKFHNRAFTGTWDYNKFTKNYVGSTDSTTYGKSTITSLNGYFYVTLGGYNWVIIGRNSNLNWVNTTFTNTYAQSNEQISNFIKFASYSTYANALKSQIETTTDAGVAINSANVNGIINTVSSISRSYSINLASYTSPVASSDLDDYPGCVLCLCAGTTGDSYYKNTSPYYSYFPSSDLDTAMTNIYNNIKSAAGNAIQLTSLTTYGYNGGYKTYTHSEYLFPLATNTVNSSQNYCVETYLNSTTKRDIDTYWWLRSGDSSYFNYAWFVFPDGSLNGYPISSSLGVRPAFVLKIT